MEKMMFSKAVLDIEPSVEISRISDFIREMTLKNFKRKGAVIGLSGGIDSAISAALCITALGPERVLGVILPEKDSNNMSEQYAKLLADRLGIQTEKIDLTPVLEEFGVYEKRDQVVSKIWPDFDPSTWRYKIVLPQDLLDRDSLNVFSLVVQLPDGTERTTRLSTHDYLQMVASTNIKQRTRMIYLYYFSEKNNYLVSGTTNRTELRQGFFVKYGDGGVDLEPLAHLYKSQLYMLARYLDIPKEIRQRSPSPDTYTAEVSDTEFYFSIPFHILDPFLWADENNIPRAEVCQGLSLTEEQYNRLKRNVDGKSRATWHCLQVPPAVA
jgi:NAD+ synthase